jgi:hypothetical protein
MPHEKDDRHVGPLRYELSVHGVSLNRHTRRHDHYEFVDAEGEDMLCLSRAGNRIEPAQSGGEGAVPGMSRRAQ